MLVKYRLKNEFYAQLWARLILSILLLFHITLNITIDSIVFFRCILIHSYQSYRQVLQWKSKTKYFLTLTYISNVYVYTLFATAKCIKVYKNQVFYDVEDKK